ncbi:MSMEG_1061 family FMN-dependent PPOX-type flavoprotein [Aerophototrophica crusticola]|uniref:MSMEG_1061 family FMN-dependent PPOX-type flavoprotein n=1 Tax=Aerophototrophica crusticola TaxID=1709002 RepID=UPI0009535F8A
MRITDPAELDRLYGRPGAASVLKVADHLTPAYRDWLEASPFYVLATRGPQGLDCSPRGDRLGELARVADERTLLLPDRRGNNRIDSLRNILHDPQVGLIFLTPGIGEALRVNGTAEILADEALNATFAVDGKAPKVVVRVSIRSVYFQCARAVARSGLWDPATFRALGTLPTAGVMLAEASAGREGGAAYDAALAERQRQTMY